MSIGKVVNNAILVKNDDPTQVKTVRVTKGILDRDNNKFTVTEWGEDIFDWAYERIDERWRIGGLSGAVALFNIYTGNERNITVYLGGQDVESFRSYTYNETRENPREGEQWSNANGFKGGCGLYLFYDGTTNPEKPTYFFIGAPVALIYKTPIVAHPVPYEHTFIQHKGYEVNGLWYPYISKTPYTDNIFRDYSESDYDPRKANPTTIQGFPFGVNNNGLSTSKGGQGDMVDWTEDIPIDTAPRLTTGDFLRVYKMSAVTLNQLREKLISNGFLDNLISKLRTNAMDYIMGLTAIPLSASNVATGTIQIGNLDTEVSAEFLSWYIGDLDCGEIDFTEYFQTYMDYSPYTKVSVYLPFCGIIPLSVDAFMNDKLKLTYRVDFLTGYCVAFISNSHGIVTTASGQCGYQLPIRSNDYSRVISSGLGIVGGAASAAWGLATGNIPLAAGGVAAYTAALSSTVNNVNKPDVMSNGALGGNFGLLGNRTPYIIIQRPTISIPKDYAKTLGYMSRISAKLGDLKGFTRVEEIHLEHINASAEEKGMIESLLKEGVIL